MTYRDILLPILSYPDTLPAGPLEAAFNLAKQLGAGMTALVLELDAHRSAWPSSFGTHLANISDLMGEALAQSHANSRNIVEQVKREAARSSISANILRDPTTVFPAALPVVERAMLHDLTIVPAISGFDRWFNETIVFGSGSPVLLLPDERASVSLGTVAVAWDFSLAASRAVRASLPLLSKAGEIRIFTIANEKSGTAGKSIEDLRRHLAQHDISFVHDEVDIAGRNIGDSFREYARTAAADVLVMGAFGHSRVREFVLGGATKSMLTDPTLPVLFAH